MVAGGVVGRGVGGARVLEASPRLKFHGAVGLCSDQMLTLAERTFTSAAAIFYRVVKSGIYPKPS